MAESEIIFSVRESPEGGYEARALGYSIFTQAESMEELKAMIDIERFIAQKIPRLKLKGFPYFYTALFEEAKGPVRPVKGFRTSRGYSFGRYGR